MSWTGRCRLAFFCELMGLYEKKWIMKIFVAIWQLIMYFMSVQWLPFGN